MTNSNKYTFKIAMAIPGNKTGPQNNLHYVDWAMAVNCFLDAYSSAQYLSDWLEENNEDDRGRLFLR